MLVIAILAAILATVNATNLRTLSQSLLDPTKTEWGGAGGNAYVIRFIKSDKSVNIDKGVVAKAFRNKEDRDEAYSDLAKLPNLRVLAGLAYPKGDQDDNTFEGDCVHVDPEKDCCGGMKASDTCYFLALDNAGDKTMEQCMANPTIGYKTIKYMTVQALEDIKTIHKRGWSHNDYQLKNIMFNTNCQSASLRACDLDGMSQKNVGGVRMMRDLAMMLGTCQAGGWEFDETLNSKADAKSKEMAKAIYEVSKTIMKDYCDILNVVECKDDEKSDACVKASGDVKHVTNALIKGIKSIK